MSTKLNYENLHATVRTNITKISVTGITYTTGNSVLTLGGDTITVSGTNFLSGLQVYIGSKLATSVTIVSSTQLTVVVPANTAGDKVLTVISNSSVMASYKVGVRYASGPYWSTASGSLGNVNSGSIPGFTLTATSDSTITYTVTSGSLPSGVTLNSSTGMFDGAAPSLSTDTVYSFTVTATNAQNQSASRNFTMTVIPTDIIYWTSPVQSQSYSFTTSALTQINVSATSKSGNTISVAVSNLPAGLSYVPSTTAGFSIGSIVGVPGVNGTYTVTLVATVANTGVQQTITITMVVNKTNGQIIYDTPGTYTWVCPTGVTSISLVLVGGGGGSDSWGGGGGGGALTYTNNYAVSAGTGYTVTVGGGGDSFVTQGGNSWFNTAAITIANGGKKGVAGTSMTGGGGGGAGGYAGAGGAGSVATTPTYAGGAGGTSAGTSRTGGFSGGAGGGGKSTNVAVPVPAAVTTTFGAGAGGGGAYGQCYGGGGVGLMGAISQSGNPTNIASVVGGDATFAPNGGSPGLYVVGGQDAVGYYGGWPGGGGAGVGNGAGGAVRIIWPGASRTFPSTNTLDL